MKKGEINVINLGGIKGIYCIGDIHGRFDSINNFIRKNDICDSLIIICGDCGFGFENIEYYQKKVFPSLKRNLTKYKDTIIFIRGNHDDPSYYNNSLFNFKRIKTIPDYTVLNVFSDKGKTVLVHSILCIGGATSIDRLYRININNRNIVEKMLLSGCNKDEAIKTAKRTYWDDEAPAYNEDFLKRIDRKRCPIDIVCSHTAPSFCTPRTTEGLESFMKYDKFLSKDLYEERKVFDYVYSYLRNNNFMIKRWYYGHFHRHYNEVIDDTCFVLLDMYKDGKLDFDYIE